MSSEARTEGLAEPVTVGALAAGVLAVIDPPDLGTPWCPSVWLFSTACPLCGLTRGVSRLVRGDVEASLAFHPLAWLVVAVAAAAWLAWLGRRAGWWRWRSKRLERAMLWTVGIGLIVAWITRAAAGDLPPVSG